MTPPTWDKPITIADGLACEATIDWLLATYGPPSPLPRAPSQQTSAVILSLSDVAAYFGVSTKTLINVFVRQRGLKALHLGREWRFRAEDVRAFEQEQFVTHGRRRA